VGAADGRAAHRLWLGVSLIATRARTPSAAAGQGASRGWSGAPMTDEQRRPVGWGRCSRPRGNEGHP
jgi:hypothetical protein